MTEATPDKAWVHFLGLHIKVVESGTVVIDDRSGENVAISDEIAARKGNFIFCTQNTFDAFKRKLQ